MKIRTGFVSNSSTTSFCIFGLYLEDDELLEENMKSLLGEEFELYEMIDEAEPTGGIQLEYYKPEEFDGGCFLGRSLTTINGDETGDEFKDRVVKNIKKVLPEIKMSDLSYHQESYRD